MSKRSDTTLISTEERVKHALDSFSSRYRDWPVEEQLPRLSIHAFISMYHLSRSTLYARHPGLIKSIRERFELLSSERAALATKKHERRSVSALEKELAAANKRHKLDYAKLAHQKLSDFVDQLGPELREKRLLVLKLSDAYAKIEQLESTIASLLNTIQSLSTEVNE